MAENFDELLRMAKIMACVEDDSHDELFELYINEAVDYIKAFCHLDVLPYALRIVAASATASRWYKIERALIKAVKEGDREIEFVSMDELMKAYAERLAPYVNKRGFTPSDMDAKEQSL